MEHEAKETCYSLALYTKLMRVSRKSFDVHFKKSVTILFKFEEQPWLARESFKYAKRHEQER